MFRAETTPEDRWKPTIKADTLTQSELGKEIQVIAGPRSQTGTLVGRVLNKLLIEFPNGTTRMVAEHMCRFVEVEETP